MMRFRRFGSRPLWRRVGPGALAALSSDRPNPPRPASVALPCTLRRAQGALTVGAEFTDSLAEPVEASVDEARRLGAPFLGFSAPIVPRHTRCYSSRPSPPGRWRGSEIWAVSSAVEHYLDMVGVTGSIPVPPTTDKAVRPCLAVFVWGVQLLTAGRRLLSFPGSRSSKGSRPVNGGPVCDMSTTTHTNR